MTPAIARDQGSSPSVRPSGERAPGVGRAWRWVLAAVVLAAGLSTVAIRHAPPTTWAVPVALGPLVDDALVWSIRRLPTEVRLEVGPDHDRATVRLLHIRHPDDHPRGRRVAGVKVLPDPGPARGASDAELDAVAARLEAWHDRPLRSPDFVAPLGARMTPRQRAEAVVLDVLLVTWLSGVVLASVRLLQALAASRRAALGLGGLVVAQQAVVAGLGVHGVWHSNQHGYDRVADVAQLVPPAVASLGLLHGYGFYAVYHPLQALTGAGVLHLAPWVASALLVATFAWLRLLWQADRPALLGTALLASTPVLLRLAGTESMYVPAALWVVTTLALFELYLRTDDDRWFLLGLPPAFLAMQTRAELMALLPAWLVLLVVVRRPAWLRDGWRRPAVVLGVAGAGALFLPRLLALVDTPPPADLRRSATDPLADPRLLVLAAVAMGALVAWPPLRARLAPAWRRWGWRGPAVLGAVLALGGAAYGLALRAQGGPRQRMWQVHPAFDPDLTAPWISLLVLAGAAWTFRRAPGRHAFLAGSWALAMLVYLPQYDCLSTYVRTSLATWPLLVALAAPALDALTSRRGGAWVVAALVAGGAAWGVPWLTHRYPKQLQWDVVQQLDRELPADAVLVWLSESDVPADAAARGFRTTRARLDHWLPHRRTLGVDAWRRGEAPADAQVVFVQTADCHRVLFRPRDDVALAGDREVRWRYLDRSLVAAEPRVAVDDLPDGWMQPGCAEALAAATEVLLQVPLPSDDTGSVYETLFGRPALGAYRIPARP